MGVQFKCIAMKNIVYSLFAAMFMLIGCSEEDSLKHGNNALGSMSASIEQNPFYSRVQINDNNGGATLSWVENDAFKTFGDVEAEYTYDVASAEFKVGATAPQSIEYAAYPSAYTPSVSETSLTMELPLSITNVEKQSNVPMWAGTPVDGHLSFKHLAALLKIDLTGIKDFTTIVVTADKALAGSFVVDLTDENPVLASSSSEENQTVTITLNDVTDDAEVIYLPIPATTYGSLKVTAKSETEEKVLKYWESLEFKRAMMYTASIVNLSTPEGVSEVLSESLGTTPVVLNLPSDFTTVSDGGSNASIKIPDVEGSDLTLNFDAAPTTTSEAPLVIESSEENEEVGASTKNLTLSIPSDDSNQVNVQIDTPTTTATVASGNYASLTATTATNTLIIYNKVKIDNLTILGGNVLIEVGTEIGQIDNRNNAEIKYIIRDEAGLNQAFATGGKGNQYIVFNDIALSNSSGVIVNYGIQVNLDLNNKTIVANGDAFVVGQGGTLILNGSGYVKAGNEVGNWVAVWANGGMVVINDGNYTVGLDNTDSNSCIYAKNGGQVIINGGTFSHEIPVSGNNYGMPLQVNNDDSQGKIIVNGGVFVLDNDRYYEEQDKVAGKIVIAAAETRDNGKVIVSGATGKTIVIENTELSDALYKLYGDIYYMTINSDGYAEMRESEVLAITHLNLDPYEYDYQGSITTLKGIEHFVNLQILECRNKDLKECDLSKNVALTEFAVQHTTELTTLDFSHNPNIRALYLNYNRGLSSLNLTGCTQLGNIQLFGSALTSLDIPNKEGVYNLLFGNNLKLNPNEYPNLTGLGCENMALTALDDTFIDDKIKGQLTYLSCENNQIESIDLSKYSSLQFLKCGSNNIENLDLTKTPYLMSLSCYGNKIKELDITANEYLNEVYCGNQQDEIVLQLKLTLSQKSILVDNGPMNPEEENVKLISNVSGISTETINDGGKW